jgi:hypothetical protein
MSTQLRGLSDVHVNDAETIETIAGMTENAQKHQ